jgi:thiol-disulfide isomerase/thioredoxin
MIIPPRRLLALAFALAGLGVAVSAADAQADADYAALTALAAQPPPWASRGPNGELKNDRKPAPSESLLWRDRQAEAKAKAALKFMADHPADPRRWDAAAIAANSLRDFIVAIKPGYDEAVAARDAAKRQALIEYDTAARTAWQERMQALEAAILVAPDASAEAVGGALSHAAIAVFFDKALSPAEKLAKYRGIYASFAQRAPESRYFSEFAGEMLRLAERTDPTSYAGLLQEMKASPQAKIAALAADRLAAQAARKAGFDLQFTAVDDREVDLTKLRGKVVLIDFWATWCGPCKAELPNIVANYQKYHDKGFEVVGISLDQAADRQTLIDYCREHGLAWPQHFDGKFWKNEIAVKFGIRSIPAMFLLDQDGKLVSTNARGPKLEAEVKRLLKL